MPQNGFSSQVLAQRQAEYRAALPGAAAGAQENHGRRRPAYAGRGEAPFRAPKSREFPPPAADHHPEGREDELAAANLGAAASHPGDRGADRQRLECPTPCSAHGGAPVSTPPDAPVLMSSILTGCGETAPSRLAGTRTKKKSFQDRSHAKSRNDTTRS